MLQSPVVREAIRNSNPKVAKIASRVWSLVLGLPFSITEMLAWRKPDQITDLSRVACQLLS
jgi:hypothetical protein